MSKLFVCFKTKEDDAAHVTMPMTAIGAWSDHNGEIIVIPRLNNWEKSYTEELEVLELGPEGFTQLAVITPLKKGPNE